MSYPPLPQHCFATRFAAIPPSEKIGATQMAPNARAKEFHFFTSCFPHKHTIFFTLEIHPT